MKTKELIYNTMDEYGSIEVIDYMQQIRAMHFGNRTQQSAMLLSHPYLLVHRYTQAMLFPSLYKKPENVLVLGLGAGSIVKYLYNYFEEANIEAVELRKSVVNIAIDYFMLPELSPRLNIYTESIDQWLSRDTPERLYDFIVVDMFLTTSKGQDYSIDISDKILLLYKALTDDGAIVFNHLGDNLDHYEGIKIIKRLFKKSLYSINIDCVNTIIIGTKFLINFDIDHSQLHQHESLYRLPYSQYINSCSKVN